MSLPMGGPFRDNPVSADNSFAINSKIMIVAVVVLFGVVMFILGLHVYAKWFWRHGQNGGIGRGLRRRRRLEFAADLQGHQRTSTHVGLEKSVLDQLPTFTFDQEKASVNNEGARECAVCLEEFADGEKGRLLPKCNHSFHIECIDMWFHSHSTCPLCRCSVGPESSSSTAVTIVVQQPSDSSQNDDEVGARPSPLDAVVFSITDGVAFGGRSSDYRQEGTLTSSGAATVLAVVEHGAEFYSLPDSSAVLTSPRQQQQQQGSRPESPSSRRPSTGLSPKPSGIQFPANVLFWGNQTQMNAAGAGTGAGPREENSGRRRFSSGVHAPSSLVIEIPRAQPLDGSTVCPAHHQNSTNSSDEAYRTSDAQAGGGGGGPKSPIGRLVSSSFRRLLSIRRGPTSPGPEGTCSSFDCEQQPQGSTISSSAGTTTVQGSRQG